MARLYQPFSVTLAPNQQTSIRAPDTPESWLVYSNDVFAGTVSLSPTGYIGTNEAIALGKGDVVTVPGLTDTLAIKSNASDTITINIIAYSGYNLSVSRSVGPEGFGMYKEGCGITKSGVHPNGWINWDTELWDTDNCWSAADPQKIYIKTNGIYIVNLIMPIYPASSPGVASCYIMLNGSIFAEHTTYWSNTTNYWTAQCTTISYLTNSDFLQATAYIHTGSATFAPREALPRFVVHRIGS